MGMGSPLLSGLMAGGLGYLLGSNMNQQVSPQMQQVAPAPTAPPSYGLQTTETVQSADSGNLAQLKLLGVLTDDEFTREKNRILAR